MPSKWSCGYKRSLAAAFLAAVPLLLLGGPALGTERCVLGELFSSDG
jgi:hypothetical protein